MKKQKKRQYWALAIFLLAPVIVNAQLNLGVKGGLNIATVKFDREVVNSDNITGFQLGPMVEYLNSTTGWGMDVALLFTQKGCEWEKRAVKNNYLEMPLNVKWKMQTPLVKPYIAAGPYVGVRMGGRKFWDLKGISSDVEREMKAGTFSAGLNFSAGAELLGFLQIGLNYGWGLTDNYKTFDAGNPQEYKGKTHTWSISAAVLF